MFRYYAVRSRRRLLEILFTISVAIASSAFAHDKTDVVTMLNGDRITGEIKGMAGGKLEIKTDYADAMFIQWQDVATVKSNYNFEVRLDSGERVLGNVTKTDRIGEIQLTSIDDQLMLTTLEVVELRPFETELEDQIDYRFSTTLYADPTVKTFSINGDVSFEGPNSRSSMSGVSRETHRSVTDTNTGDTYKQTESSSNFTLQQQRWTQRAESFRLFTGTYSKNDAIGNEGRFSAGFGLGRYFIDRAGLQLNGAVGVQGVTERRLEDIAQDDGSITTQSIREQQFEAFLNGQWRIYRFDNLDMDISVIGNVYPSFTDWGRTRADLQILIDWELINDIYWTVQARTDIDTGLETDSRQIDRSSDYSITTGLSWRP